MSLAAEVAIDPEGSESYRTRHEQPQSVAEIVDQHVTFELQCIDRMYLKKLSASSFSLEPRSHRHRMARRMKRGASRMAGFGRSLAPYGPVFIIGMLEGWKLRGHTEEFVEARVMLAFFNPGGKFTFADLADMMTSVYADAENISLPVGWVAMACLAVERGATARDAVFVALRKHLAGLNGTTRPASEMDPINVILSSRK